MSKKRFWIGICALALLFSSCAPPIVEKTEAVRVILLENDGYTCVENVIKSEAGKDVAVRFKMNEGYVATDCNYKGEYTLTSEGDEMVLSLKNVRFDVRLELDLQTVAGQIIYRLNGGSFLDIPPRRNGLLYCS